MTRTMVATEARKARRMAAAAAAAAAEGKTLDAKSLEKAPVKPLPASTPPAHRREPSAHQTRAGVGGPSRPDSWDIEDAHPEGHRDQSRGQVHATRDSPGGRERGAQQGNEGWRGSRRHRRRRRLDRANPSKADWTCVKCGKSNFAKRLACFKCASPKPGRTFTAAGMKGYEKRLARREAKRAAETAAPGGKTSPIDESSADQSKKSKPAEDRPKKTSFGDDAGDDAGDVNGTGDAKDPKKGDDDASQRRTTRSANEPRKRRATSVRLRSAFETQTRTSSTSLGGPRRIKNAGTAQRKGSSRPTGGSWTRTSRTGSFTTRVIRTKSTRTRSICSQCTPRV